MRASALLVLLTLIASCSGSTTGPSAPMATVQFTNVEQFTDSASQAAEFAVWSSLTTRDTATILPGGTHCFRFTPTVATGPTVTLTVSDEPGPNYEGGVWFRNTFTAPSNTTVIDSGVTSLNGFTYVMMDSAHPC